LYIVCIHKVLDILLHMMCIYRCMYKIRCVFIDVYVFIDVCTKVHLWISWDVVYKVCVDRYVYTYVCMFDWMYVYMCVYFRDFVTRMNIDINI